MTPYQSFCEKWKDGCGAEECARARRVFARGKIPAEVLFCGEAPGQSEDALGLPFVGPAGRLFDQIIDRAVPPEVRYVLTNLVLCIPREEDGGKAGEPSVEQIWACAPRLTEFIKLCNPKLIVCVGTLARDWTDPKMKNSVRFHKEIPMAWVYHPAYLLRQNLSQQGLEVKRAIVTIKQAVEEFVLPKP